MALGRAREVPKETAMPARKRGVPGGQVGKVDRNPSSPRSPVTVAEENHPQTGARNIVRSEVGSGHPNRSSNTGTHGFGTSHTRPIAKPMYFQR